MGRFWNPPLEVSKDEQRILDRCAKRKLFQFLRLNRHLLFDSGMQEALQAMYPASDRGKDKVPPALLAMATLMQAAFEVPDNEMVEMTLFERRWQMVLDCIGTEKPPFSQGTLFNFRERLVETGLYRLLIEKTIQLARDTGGFGATHLRAALDSSPLWGAGRVEDTFNLIGHAAWLVVRTAAKRLNRTPEEVAAEAGIPLVNASSIKAGLDLDWDQPQARRQGLNLLLGQVRALGDWLGKELAAELDEEPLKGQWQTVQAIVGQDTEPDPDGTGNRITRGVAKDRRISISDLDMRHGRKSKSQRVDGYKRHVATDLDSGLILAVAVTPANQPERDAIPDLLANIDRQNRVLTEMHIDRGYLGHPTIELRRQQGMALYCKPFPLRNGPRFTKESFALDFETRTVTCPDGVTLPLTLGQSVQFPKSRCLACPQRDACTRGVDGRSLTIHPLEPLYTELRARRRTPEGRAKLRERTAVEHSNAALGLHQGKRARYRGLAKNLFDTSRHAAVVNLHVLARMQKAAAFAAA